MPKRPQPQAFTRLTSKDPEIQSLITDIYNKLAALQAVQSGASPGGKTGQLQTNGGNDSLAGGDLSGDVSTAGSTVTTLANSGVTDGAYGDATHVPRITVNKKGIVISIAPVSISSGGAVTLAGDATGPSGSNTVAKIQNRPISVAAPSTGDVLEWNGSAWTPVAPGAASQTPWLSTIDGANHDLINVHEININDNSLADYLVIRPAIGTGRVGMTLRHKGASATDEFTISGLHATAGFGWRQRVVNDGGSWAMDVINNGTTKLNVATINSRTGWLGGTGYGLNSCVRITDYDYSIPGLTIPAGANSITILPFPGLSGGNSPQYIHLTGGAGPDETVILTGGSGTNLQFTCAHAHTTISSASSGLQEAYFDPLRPTSTLFVPTGTHPVWAPSTFNTPFKLVGEGKNSSILQAQSTFGMITALDGSCLIEHVQFSSLAQQTVGGFGVKITATSPNINFFSSVLDCGFFGLYDCIISDRASGESIIGCTMFQFSSTGVLCTTAGGDGNGPSLIGNYFFVYSLGAPAFAAININAGGQMVISDNNIGGLNEGLLNYGLYISPGSLTTGVFIEGNEIQTVTIAGIYITSTLYNLIQIVGNSISQPANTGGSNNYVGVNITDTGSPGTTQGVISGNVFQGGGTVYNHTGIAFNSRSDNWLAGDNTFIHFSTGYSLASSGSVTVGMSNYVDVTSPIVKTGSGTEWTAPTLLNGWGNSGSPYNPCGFRVFGSNVQLRGQIQSGTIAPNTTLFTLPAGYRPSANVILTTSGYSSIGSTPKLAQLVVTSGGAVGLEGNNLAAFDFLSLDSLFFSIT